LAELHSECFHSIQDGFQIDAKTLMSLAEQSSRSTSIEMVKKDLSFRHIIVVLQKETSRLYEEIKRFPLKLIIPAGRLDVNIELQTVLVDMMQKYYLETCSAEFTTIFRYSLEKLAVSRDTCCAPTSILSELEWN